VKETLFIMRQYSFTHWLRGSALVGAFFSVVGIVFVAPSSCVRLETLPGSGPASSGSTTSAADPYVKAHTVVGTLSLEEKATLMRGEPSGCGSNLPQTDNIFTTPGVTNKIAGFKFRDGPRGICLAANLRRGATGYSTVYPVGMSRGATFDFDLEKQIGEAMGDEMVASGHTMLLAPVINILRHPAWGRAQETYGEDVYLLGRLGTAFTIGAQEYVPACAKHYAANNIEYGRGSAVAIMDEQTLHEIYARHFEMVIQDVPGGVACIMAAYNLVQVPPGQAYHCTQSRELLTDMLRNTFGFKGFVLSDWWALPGGLAQCAASPDQEKFQAAAAVSAGLDMELPWSYHYTQLSADVTGGQLMEAQITAAAERIVAQQIRFNVLDPTTGTGLKTATTAQDPTSFDITGNDAHIQLSRRAATESMVLLKNDKNTLPIDKTKVHSIAVLGAVVPFSLSQAADVAAGTVSFTTNELISNGQHYFRSGDLGSSRVFSDPAKSRGPLAGIQAAASGITVTTGSDVTAAANADFVVVVGGLTPEDEGEEYTGAADRYSFSLDDKNIRFHGGTAVQDTLIKAVAALNKPMVVVLEGGSVIDMPWLSMVPAVVMAWYPGQDGGGALADLLFGTKNFSGKLPLTWPNASTPTAPFGDEPLFSDPSTRTRMGFWLGYRYYDHMNLTPLFAFGSGLSYTTYAYSGLAMQASAGQNDTVNVSFDVQNAGTQDGDEVSFLFVTLPANPNVQRSVKELKGFTRTSIKAGAMAHVTIPLRVSDLKYWDTASSAWKVDSGAVKIMVGGSSDKLPLTRMLTIN
jgi:beta-glucosidase